MIVNLDNINPTSSTAFNFTWKNCDLITCSDVTQPSITYTSLRPTTLNGFLKISLPDVGKKFTTNLATQGTITCTDTNAVNCFDDNKILACKNNYFWNFITNTYSCAQNCGGNAYPRYLYLNTQNGSQSNKASDGTNTGYCNGSCDSSTAGKIRCPSNSGQLNESVYNSLSCNGDAYTSFSFFCLKNDYTYMSINNETQTGSIFYSQGFNSDTIEITVPALTEYHFEMWFMPDLIFLNKITSGSKFYVLWTNSISIKKDSKNSVSSPTTNDYKVYKAGNAVIPTNSQNIEMKNGQWFKISYSVVKNVANNKWDLYFYYKNSNDNGYKSTGLTDVALNKIAFCTNTCNNYFTDGVWYSGAYKLLKVWDATFLSRDVYYQMDQL